MTFLNWTMLLGLIAIAIPILIHLLNRRKAKTVDWGAMRFLLASAASRNRRVLIEEIVLMTMRCLLVALVALAMARPFLPSRSTIPWAVVLPTVLAAAMCAGIGAAMWSCRPARWAFLGAAAALLIAALVSSAVEHFRQGRKWAGDEQAKDVAIVIDGSMSMTLAKDGKTNFHRAIEEARAAVAACRPSDAIGLILAGSTPRAVVAKATADHEQVTAALGRLRAHGGTMKVLEALNAAVETLAEGKNPAKKIILITDGQNVGWDLTREARWRFLAAGLECLPTRPEIIVRTLGMPESFNNVCVSGLTFSREVVGTDRPVRIEVKLANTGSSAIRPSGVVVTIDGEALPSEEVGEIPPNGSQAVSFSHRFDRTGPHAIMAEVLCEDDMATDNTARRVLCVMQTMPVLIVDGAPSLRPLEGAAEYIEVALSPGLGTAQAGGRDADGKGFDSGAQDEQLGRLLDPAVIAAPDFSAAQDLSRYCLVVLANVSRLPGAVAEKLAGYVRGGGSLLIAPGDRASPDFYNSWHGPAGEPVVPAALMSRCLLSETPTRWAIKTFTHPALSQAADLTQSDAETVLVNAYWRLMADEKDPTVRVGGRLQTGDPLLVERKVGRGCVLVTATSLHRRDSNLPGKDCFVFTMHEIAYYLAAPRLPAVNVEPGSAVTIELPATGEDLRGISKGQVLEVLGPSNRLSSATVVSTAGPLTVRLGEAEEPGLHRLVLPPKPSDKAAAPVRNRSLPFAVKRMPEESRLVALSQADLAAVANHVKLSQAVTTDELTAFVAGGVPGEELWKYLAIAALLAALGEIALTRWIAVQRKSHEVHAVDFGSEALDVEAFRARARDMLAVSRQPSQASR